MYPENKRPKNLVIYIPGYRGAKSELPYLNEFFSKKLGYHFLVCDYKIENQDGSIKPLSQIKSYIRKQLADLLATTKFENYYLMGYSLGAALAIELASDKILHFKKIILLSIFDNRATLLKKRNILIADKENIIPLELIKTIDPKTDLLFIHGKFDEAIPIALGFMVYKNATAYNAKFISLPINHTLQDIKDINLILHTLASDLSPQKAA